MVAEVLVCYETDGILVQIDDAGPNGPGADPVTGSHRPRLPGLAGNGILGMSERANALGGTLAAGPRSDGGFRVRAWLPLVVAVSAQ